MSRAVSLTVALLLAACGSTPRPDTQPAEPRELTNLRAFARLYGVLRFFHPSDEAAAIDWNRYAVLGVARVRAARDTAALAAELDALVLPIAPTVRIVRTGATAVDPPELAPVSREGLELVAWQHQGPGFDGGQAGAYLSKRTTRDAFVLEPGSGWTSVTQSIDAAPYRAKPFRLRAHVKAGSGVQVGAWARVDRTGGGTGFFDNMDGRMISGPAWTEAVVEGTIDADAASLVFGGLIMGAGDAWLDGFELTIAGAPVTLANPGFEDGTTGWGGGIGKAGGAGASGYKFDAVDDAHAGKKALHVAPAGEVVKEDLFAARPNPGEIAEVELGGGLRARVPIAVWSKGGHTLPRADPKPVVDALAGVTTTLDDRNARVADVIVAWSVLDQFFPYFDVTGADWPAVLDRVLTDALDDTGAADHERTLERLIAAVQDGHGGVRVQVGERDGLPLALTWAEDKLVVTASGAPDIVRGDVIETIDGVAAADALAAAIERHSGSPQWRRHLALRRLVRAPPGTKVALQVSSGGPARAVTVTTGDPPAADPSQPPIAQLDGGIWYVDLARAETITAILAAVTAAKAPGVVFDLRGYPNGTHGVINHLLKEPEKDRWMHIAAIVRPALPGAPRPAPVWDSIGWDMTPDAPAITGTVVFLTGGGAISYAESVMGYVEALGLPIVGAATAGSNGNVRSVTLPTGSSFTFTGMKVTRHDGVTASHLTGIRPTIPVEPTVAGIRAGTDEVLERALVRIRTGK